LRGRPRLLYSGCIYRGCDTWACNGWLAAAMVASFLGLPLPLGGCTCAWLIWFYNLCDTGVNDLLPTLRL
jgi:hypothetical protein